MTSESIRIGRLRIQHFVPPSLASTSARLDGIIRDATEDTLASTLARAGVDLGSDEEICVRAVHTILRPRLSASDSTIAIDWSLAIADEIARLLRVGGDGVARYASRSHALIDLVRSASRGDIERAWAWEQLDLWTAPTEGLTVMEAAGQAFVALTREARLAPALLGLVAEMDGATLSALLTHGTALHWQRLARAALRAFDADPALASVPVAAVAPDVRIPASEQRRVQRILRASMIASRLAGVALRDVDATTRRALGILTTLETEPGAVRGDADTVARSLTMIAERLGRERSDDDFAPEQRAATSDTSARIGRASRDDGMLGNAATHTMSRRVSGKLAAHRRSGAARDETVFDGRADVVHDEHNESGTERGFDETPARRHEWRTDAGGLLFLLNVAVALRIPEQIDASSILSERPLRWVFHSLARSLFPIDARDPAALVFAGLPPWDVPPTTNEPPASVDELAAIDGLRRQIVDALRMRLPEIEGPESAVLAYVCTRRATIVADPAWIEVRLSLDDVSLAVRRAVLDADPGWLPWLGAVVRFVYA